MFLRHIAVLMMVKDALLYKERGAFATLAQRDAAGIRQDKIKWQKKTGL